MGQNLAPQLRTFVGHQFWARDSLASTGGADEKVINADIQTQEGENKLRF